MLNVVSEEAKSKERGLFKVLYICFTDFVWIAVCVMYSVKRKIKIKLYQPFSNGLFALFLHELFPRKPTKNAIYMLCFCCTRSH